jgi:YHS domain-containing protein
MKKMSLSFTSVFLIAVFFVISCHSAASNESHPDSAVPIKTDSTAAKFTAAMVDNRKDPSCGMPVTAGIEDTLHYSGKVYGFCSEECKQAFLKNPVELAKNADLRQ